jgi:hypothetical protein
MKDAILIPVEYVRGLGYAAILPEMEMVDSEGWIKSIRSWGVVRHGYAGKNNLPTVPDKIHYQPSGFRVYVIVRGNQSWEDGELVLSYTDSFYLMGPAVDYDMIVDAVEYDHHYPHRDEDDY